jgi:hypothetical protein
MKTKLYHHPNIEIRMSNIHGYGVFATDDIGPNVILEEVPFVTIHQGVAHDYAFLFPRGGTPLEETIGVKNEIVLALGYASLYNHAEYPNASWKTDVSNRLFVFFTKDFIQKNEEITVYYGPDSYWSEHPHVNKQ